MSEMLKVSDLHVYYGSIHAVKGVSFEVHEGEVVTLIGANGAGKSTILNTVSGLLHPRSGSILFHGKDLHGVPAHKLVGMGLAQVPEGRHVFLQMTVQENLEMGAFSQPSSGIEADLESVYQRFPRLLERRTLHLPRVPLPAQDENPYRPRRPFGGGRRGDCPHPRGRVPGPLHLPAAAAFRR